MFRVRWARRAALVMLSVTAACASDDASKQESAESEVAVGDDAGESEPLADAGAPAARDAATSSSDATSSGTSEPEGGGAQERYLRVDEFLLKQPGLVLRVLGIETEITSDVQSMLDSSLADDMEPKDGTIDLNILLRFAGTSDPAKTAGKVSFGGGLCPYPADATKPCRDDAAAPFFEPPLSFSNADACGLQGGGQSLSGACFQSSVGRMAVSLPLFGPVVLDDAQVIATWSGAGDAIAEGWIRGFVSEKTAMETKIPGAVPAHLALVDVKTGTPLTSFLPEAAREMRGGVAGWPFLAQFKAKAARFQR